MLYSLSMSAIIWDLTNLTIDELGSIQTKHCCSFTYDL